MNDDLTPPPLTTSYFKPFRQRSGTATKMLTVFILLLLLLIPLEMVKSVLHERLQRRSQAINEITSTWGNTQELAGPILMVPYKQKIKVFRDQVINGRTEKVSTTESIVANAYFLPAELKINGHLDPSILHRGIYEAVVYGATLNFSGTFTRPLFDDWKVPPEDILWNEAVVMFLATDLRGAKEALTIKLADRLFKMTPGAKFQDFPSGVQARLTGFTFDADSVPFEMKITLNGSRGIRLTPLGMQTEAQLSSSWADPSFQGSYLPLERKIGPDGFSATWKSSYYGRGYPQQWSSEEGKSAFNMPALQTSAFGVDLITVVDSYRYVERSIKYGALFLVLVFTAFFLFEILSGIRVHPFQYTLVGVALCLFYLSLLSLSEIISFGSAYLTGALFATLMISLYSARVLQSNRRALTMAAGLAGIYGFLYVILREQDYSLIFGTIGLFAAVAIVMFATRNIDWYARDEK